MSEDVLPPAPLGASGDFDPKSEDDKSNADEKKRPMLSRRGAIAAIAVGIAKAWAGLFIPNDVRKMLGLSPLLDAIVPPAGVAYAATGNDLAWTNPDALSRELVNGDFDYPGSRIAFWNWWDGVNWLSMNMDGMIYCPHENRVDHWTKWQWWNWSIDGGFDASRFGWHSTQPYVSPEEHKYVDAGNSCEVIDEGVEIQKDRNGNFYAEIVAGMMGRSIYQDIRCDEGSVMFWELWHASIQRGSWDTMSVVIFDPTQFDRNWVNYTGYDSRNFDQYRQWSIRDDDGYIDPYKICRDIRDQPSGDARNHGSAWTKFHGAYLVSPGQKVARFAFQSQKATDATTGNLIDGVRFYRAYKLVYDPNGSTVGNVPTPIYNVSAGGYNVTGYFAKGSSALLDTGWNGTYRKEADGRRYEFLGWTEGVTAHAMNKKTHDDVLQKKITQHVMTGTVSDLANEANDTVHAAYVRSPIVTYWDSVEKVEISHMELYYGAAEPSRAEAPKHTGYKFSKWDVAEISSVTEDVKVTAVYVQVPHQVVYHVDEAAFNSTYEDPNIRDQVKWSDSTKTVWVERTHTVDIGDVSKRYTARPDWTAEAKRDGHDAAHAKCTRADGSDGFDGWYSDPTFTVPFTEHTWKGADTEEQIDLYARNIGHVDFEQGKGSDAAEAYTSDLSSEPVPLDEACGMPASTDYVYGVSTKLPDVKEKDVWYAPTGGSKFDRPLRAEGGWHADEECSGDSFSSLKLLQDTTVYKKWLDSTFDGIESHDAQEG